MKNRILEMFYKEFPDLIEQMKKCSHHGDNFFSPYHAEGDIWTHTMITYASANNFSLECFLALCHDLGKLDARNIREDERVVFYGHSDSSVQRAIDVLYVLQKNLLFNEIIVKNIIKDVIPVIGNHGLYYQNSHKIKYFSNGSKNLEYFYNRLSEMDCFGSISKVKKIEYKKTKEKFIKPEIKEDVPYVYIWSGVPGSGKDYLAEKNNFPIVSFDDLRIKLYKNLSGVNFINKSDAEIYIEAFKFCNEKNFDLSTMLSIEARKCLDKGISVNICNTSLTRKSRRKIINSIGEKYNYVVKQVFAPSEIIFERNKSRSSKNIPENVIERMMKTIQVPTMFEKRICDIEYIYNGQ